MKKNDQEAVVKKQTAPALGKKHIGLWVTGILTVFVVVYIGFAIFFQSHFCFGTTIDDIKVGGCSVEKVEELIRLEMANYSLNLMEREEGYETIDGNSIDIEPVFDGEVEGLLADQNGFAWLVTAIQKQELELTKVVSYDEQKLDAAIDALSCMQAENQRTPVDAGYTEYSPENGYQLIPADFGTMINRAVLDQKVADAILVLEDTIDLDELGCYESPAVTDDNAQLLALIDELNHYTAATITYDFDETKEVLDGQTISTWLSEDASRHAVLDQEAALSFLKDLGKKYNTAYQPKELKTSYGTTITITGGAYGWKIDYDAELAQLLEEVEAGETVTREPVYSITANSHGEHDYGDSYVEINLTAQHLFLYKDGKLVVESDFVSGNISNGNGSPSGAFPLTYKTQDAVLRGQDYETPVKYWMPFAGDVGMHDATWRNSFGGNIYKTNGSHGCINLPLSVAKTIYETIDKGYAVLVYTLPGTESKAVQQQDATTVINTINTIGPVTLLSEPVIASARNLYNALPDSAKALVTNYDVLVASEAALAQLKAGEVPADQSVTDQSQPAVEQEQPVVDESQTVIDPNTAEQSQTTDGTAQ